MKNVTMIMILSLASELAMATNLGILNCGTVGLTFSRDQGSVIVAEQDETPVSIHCDNVSGQPGWGDGKLLECQGGGTGAVQSPGNCSPVYIVEVNTDGTINISKDVISCHSCADFEPVFSGICK